MNLASSTVDRIRFTTPSETNHRIRNATELNVVLAAQDGPAGIDRRLRELDEEWDIERCLETGAASLALFGAGMGSNGGRKWLLLPAAVGGLLLTHVLLRWCPPVRILRNMGVRTAAEINEERNALKALRGDFRGVTGDSVTGSISQSLEAARR